MDAEHPIPQEVSSYQFKLVGDMTIQQFFQVAAGAIVSLVIYSTNMAGYVKWPLIVVSFLVGVAFAFFPIEDRPLQKWLVLFIKAIYSPTVYVWNKNAVRHSFFQPENDPQFAGTMQSTAPVTTSGQQAGVVPVLGGQQQTNDITNESQESSNELDNLEKKEQEFLNKVNQEFKEPKEAPIIKTEATVAPKTEMKNSDPRNVVSVPKSEDVKVSPNPVDQGGQPSSGDIFKSTSSVGGQVTPMAGSDMKKAASATFAPEAAPPTPPTRPNIIVGQVLDETGKIIDGAILEIKDENGRSVRALRTNRLGHFMIVTPLSDGKYQIVSEKEGYQFEPISINLEGRVVPPIAIKGNKINQ